MEVMSWEYRYKISIEKCAKCGSNKKVLHVHHIDFNRNNNNKNNLVVLCWECHATLHRHEWDIKELGIESKLREGVTMSYTKKQKKIMEQIKKLMEWKESKDHCMIFIQAEIPDLTMHTIIALKEKGFIEEFVNPLGVKVYKLTGKELE